MYIRYGATRLDVNSATWTRHAELLHVNWVPFARRVEVFIHGTILRDTTALLAIASANWANACYTGNLDLALCTDSGGVVESLPSGPSLSGVQCLAGPNFDDEPRGATYATMRTFFVHFAAEYPTTGTNYLRWSQSITLSGGTPVYVELPSINGPWQQQRVSPTSPVTATQTGEAIGIRSVPPFPPKLFNAPLVAQQESIGSPGRVGLGLRGYPISWSYTFRTVGSLRLVAPGIPPL